MLLLGVLQAQAAGQVAAGSFDLLETQVLASSAASVTFSSLSTYAADYQHLQIRAVERTDRGDAVDTSKIQLNGVTASSYAYHYLNGDGSSVSSSAGASQTRILGGVNIGGTGTTSAFGAEVIDILDPFETTKNTTLRIMSGEVNAVAPQVRLVSGLFISTDAVTSITLAPNVGSNWVTGSRFSLYGIRGG